MAEYEDREHFIPLRKSDLIELLCHDKRLTSAERPSWRQFCALVSAVFHFEYLRQLEELKDVYAPFDPDADTKPLSPIADEERTKNEERLFEKFSALMERANFKRLSPEEVRQAIRDVASVSGLSTHVDLDMFERLEMFVRGEVMGHHHRRSWKKLWRKEEMRVPLYQRLVLIVKLRSHKRLDRDIDTSRVYLKVFKDIPKADRDMLLPGARVRFSKLDRALIVYPLAAGIGLTVYNIGADIFQSGVAAAGSLLSWGLAAAFGGYGYKTYHSYQVTKQDYRLKLTKNLYYKNLDNNTGVLMRLLDEAEEQECRESFLAYYFLWKYAPAEGWTAEQLDDYVELYLEGNADMKVDFEIGDALDKLERLKIVRKVGNGYAAQPLDCALTVLNSIWSGYFADVGSLSFLGQH